MKGMCFIEPLFEKVVKSEKTQTRRMITPEPIIKDDWFIKEIEGWGKAPFGVVSKYPDCEPERFEIMQLLKPKYQVGEIVYLKEPYVDDLIMEKTLYKYSKSDLQELISNGYGDMVDSKGFWKNKLFMPESAARYFIEITAVRAEKLQDISEEDCLKEGIELYNNYDGTYGGHSAPTAPKEAYAALINSIYGKSTWEKNPFVWVYEFRLIQG